MSRSLPNTTTLMAILQQSEYDLSKVESWLASQPEKVPHIEPENWTPKLKIIRTLFTSLGGTLTSLRVAVAMTWPAEAIIRQITYRRARRHLDRIRSQGGQVVVIAGSYAKTSTKQWLTHLMGGSYHVAATPKSINTMLGISQWLLQKVPLDTQLVVIELGEYRAGDLVTLCQLLEPDFGILTPIGIQHLEMFASEQGIIAEFRSYLEWFTERGAEDHILCHDQNRQYFSESRHQLQYYGGSEMAQYRVLQSSVSRSGTEADLTIPEQIHVFTPILGAHQVENGLPAFWLSAALGSDIHAVQKRFASMPYIQRRHEPTFAENNVLILDNSYNTNATSIVTSLSLMKALQPTRSFVVTLGFTETGSQAAQLHRKLGQQLAKACDYLGLIEAPWTRDIIEGWTAAGGNSDRVKVGATAEAAFSQLQPFVIPGSVILFEGGFQEVYLRTTKEPDVET